MITATPKVAKMIIPYISPSFFKEKQIIAFDTETFKYNGEKGEKYTEWQELANYSLYDGHRYYHGTTPEEFMDHIKILMDKFKHIVLTVHNARFDINALLLEEFFISGQPLFGLKQKKMMLGGVTYIRYAGEGCSIEFLDSRNFYKFALKKIAGMLGLEKFAGEEEYNAKGKKWNEYISKNGQELCDKDCFILYKAMEALRDNPNIISGISMASSAFKTYRANFMPCVVDLGKFNDVALEGYHGGRTEVYNRKTWRHALGLDVNSLYPYVMTKYRYATHIRQEFNVADLKEEYLIGNIRIERYNYLLNIDYKILDEDVLRVPLMINVDGLLVQLKQSTDQTITGREFLALITNNKVEYKINSCYEFFNEDLFSSYVNYFYPMKQNAKSDVEKALYKLLLNSLYGKFGQHKGHSKYTSFANIDDEDLQNYILSHKLSTNVRYNGKIYSIYGNHICETTNGEPIYSVMTAMEITANARLENYEIQKIIGFENVLYTDTDSFFTPLEKDDPRIAGLIGTELGQLKIEHEGTFEAFSPKHYIFDGNVTQKGVPKKAVKRGNEYTYDSILYGNHKLTHSIEVHSVKKVVSDKNSKMDYIEGIGHVWKNKEEYLRYDKECEEKLKNEIKRSVKKCQ